VGGAERVDGSEIEDGEFGCISVGPLRCVEYFALFRIVDESLPMIRSPFDDQPQSFPVSKCSSLGSGSGIVSNRHSFGFRDWDILGLFDWQDEDKDTPAKIGLTPPAGHHDLLRRSLSPVF
jgi:hypothetical protein